MKRLTLLLLLVAAIGCPRDRRNTDTIPTDTLTLDTVLTDLSGLNSALPPPAPDTFRARQPAAAPGGSTIPAAPSALQQAADREQSVSRFCFTEFGLKSDPTLTGNVGVVVTVANAGISNVRVGRSSWSSRAAGNQVDACLNERLRTAWKLSPGAVPAGTYQLQLSFRG